MATAEQLCKLHYSMGSLKVVKAKLRTLIDRGYIEYDAMPTKFTRSPYYYTVGKAGVRYLQSAGLDINDSFRASKEVDKHALFAAHTLELNDIILSAALLKRSNPNYWLESFIHERELKQRPYKVTWHGGRFSLIPDVFFIFRMIVPDGRQRRIPMVIEHDRGREEQPYFRCRISACISVKCGVDDGDKRKEDDRISVIYKPQQLPSHKRKLHSANEKAVVRLSG